MDAARFDTLTRSLATPRSRRRFLAGSAAALLGALGLRQAAPAQVTQADCGNVRCADDVGVCNDGCVCCVYANGNSRCRPPGKCRLGIERCPDGEVVDPVLGCVQCRTAADCPAPDAPCQAATCAAGVCGATPPVTCGTNEICEAGSCVCPSGFEVVNGGCFQITGRSGPRCKPGCLGAGSIVGSGNFLCVAYTGTSCDPSVCGTGLACQYGTLCIAPC